MYNHQLNVNGVYYCYLRKSRSDMELEKLKKLDTLKQHEKFIRERAKQLGIKIAKYYKEVVSGETIQDRPEMQKLLKEIETGKIDGVFVVEVERLSRGDTKDQGTVAQTFKYTNTKIITLNKIYDPNSDEDEEYFEFGLFMSRREYKTINRRMQRGRIANVLEGKYCGSVPPFGYIKKPVKFGKGYTLEIKENEASIVREIFNRRKNGMGINIICNWLNTLDIKPRKSDCWTSATISDLLENPVYLGKVRWNYNVTRKTISDGIISKKREKGKDDEIVIVEGLHNAIIDEDTFNVVQHQKDSKTACTKKSLETQNPLAGLIKCSFCGRNMQRRPYYTKSVNETNSTKRIAHEDTLICPKPHCENIGSNLSFVEEKIISQMKEYLKEKEKVLLEYDTTNNDNIENENEILYNELDKLNKQLNKAYELVEQGIYSSIEFSKRAIILKNKISSIEKEINENRNNYQQKNVEKSIPIIKNILMEYQQLENADKKNRLLKSLISHVDYKKTKGGRWNESDLSLVIHPKI